MTGESESYRQTLRASFISGGASALSIGISVVKTKILAIALDPAGIGLIGLYSTIMTTVVSVAGCGLNASGVRQIAEAVGADKKETVDLARRALWIAAVTLGVIGALALWLSRELIASWVFNDLAHGRAIGWLSVGVFFSLIGGAQAALLNGFRRIGDLASAGVIGTFASAVVAVAAVWLLGRDAISVIVLSAPLVSFLALSAFARRIPRSDARSAAAVPLAQLKGLLGLGLAVMGADVLTNATQLLVRLMINSELGIAYTGYFQAASAISVTYIGFVLAALSMDFYPRLAAIIQDRDAVGRLVNQQTRVALLLAGPVVLGACAIAPLMIDWLYTPAFRPAVDVLRWQLIGDALRIASWPLGLIPLAAGSAGLFFLFQGGWSLAYVGFSAIGLPWFGIEAMGIAFLLTYMLYLSVVYISATRIGVVWSKENVRLVLTLSGATLLVVGAAQWSPWLSVIGGVALSLAYFIYALKALTALADLRGLPLKVANFAVRRFRLIGRRPV